MGAASIVIHGWLSNKSYWDEEDYRNVALALVKLSTSKTIDFGFEWEYDILKPNDLTQLKNAASKLVEYIYLNNKPDENVTLIGVSHGGNVAILASMILGEKGYKVNVITLNTPQITEANPLDSKGINDFVQIITDGDLIAQGASNTRYDKNKMLKMGWESVKIAPPTGLLDDCWTKAPIKDRIAESILTSSNPIYIHSTKNVNIKEIELLDVQMSPIPKAHDIPDNRKP